MTQRKLYKRFSLEFKREALRRLHAESRGVYGSPRIREELADEGYRVGHAK